MARRPRGLLAVLVCALLALSGVAAAATPARLHLDRTLSLGRFLHPTQFAVRGSTVYVADQGRQALYQVGVAKALASGNITGVAVDSDDGSVAYSWTHGATTYLTILTHGKVYRTIELSAFEKRVNPDRTNLYGLLDPYKYPCAANSLVSRGIPARYIGKVASRPVAVAYLGHGNYTVADAAGNDVLKVTYKGVVSLVDVLPRVPVVVNATMAKADKLASCVVGRTYYAQPEPTDVEVGPAGNLYVSTRPNNPFASETGFGRLGAVWRIGRSTTRIGSGLADPSNLAVNSKGHVYVAQPYLGQIAQLVGGVPHYRMTLTGVTALEIDANRLYAATSPALVGSSARSRVTTLRY